MLKASRLLTASSLLTVFLLEGYLVSWAQLGGSSQSISVQAVQLPLSGQSGSLLSGSVSTVQSSTKGTARTVNTLNNQLQVQGIYQGSVPHGVVTPEPLPLSLSEALTKALAYNLGDVTAAQGVLQAKGESWTTLSALLPHLNANLQLVEEQISLVQAGIGSTQLFKGVSLPAVTKPFNYYDLSGSISQSVLDLTALNNYRTTRHLIKANQFLAEDAKDSVVLAVTGTYLQTIATVARVASAQAQLTSAKAVYQQALDRYKAGLNAKIDATRAQVEMQTQQQRLSTQQTDYEKQLLILKRLIGLPLGQSLTLTDNPSYAAMPPEALVLDKALAQAMDKRSDLKAAQAQVKAAQAALAAARTEYLPTAQVNASYGLVGNENNPGNSVFSVNGQVNIPVFQGEKVHGDVMQATAALNQRKAELADVQGRVEYDIRNALLDLQTAENQVQLAQSNLSLANETLIQSQDRFAAGVTDTVEVVQSQETVATSNEDYITSVYTDNLAKASLARALGLSESGVKQYLEGKP